MGKWAVAAVVGLILLPTCSDSSNHAERVSVGIRFSRFQPSHFEFESGTRVTFVIENTDPIDHEFIVGDQQVQDRHEKGTEPHHGTRPGEVSIPAGETRSTTYVFDEPGRLLVGCHLPTHYDYGMRGDIVVR